MRFRGKSIRRKIVALLLVPLVSLTAIWAFATVITGREALQLLDASDVIDKVGVPAEDAVHAIQKERRQTLVLLADPGQSDALPVLHAQQRKTDEVMGKLRSASRDGDVRDMMNDDSQAQLAAVLKAADGLDSLRRKVEDNDTTRNEAFTDYNNIVDDCYNLRTSLHAIPDTDLDKQGRALVALIRAREAISREDALYTSALTAGQISWSEMQSISNLIAERDLLYETNLPILPSSEQKVFQDYRLSKAAPSALRNAEDKILASSKPADAVRAMNQERWAAVIKPVLEDYDRLNSEATDRLQERIEPVARGVLLKAGGAGILGLLAIIASVFVSFRVGRTLIRDLSQLRKDAQEVSNVRLPSVMRRLAAGEQIDVEGEAPRLDYGSDEMGQVGQALDTLQRAAVEAAVKQADMRHGVSEVFVNLARRSQVLLHRQLTLLDSMERRTEDTDELADLFRLDHMTTRMRRHAEGLVILSGAAPSRQWRKPIQLMDVVRAAVAEVEDYERIEVRRLPRLAVNGPAVADLTHLIAELLENATVFSPPHTAVQVHGERAAKGFTLEIHDRGLGMAPEALVEANQRLAETPDFELSDTDRLGLFVVSRLAQRQGVKVSLQPSPYGGTTAIVLVPAGLLSETDDPGPEPDGSYERGDAKGRPGLDVRLQAVDDVSAVFPDRATRNSSRLERSPDAEPAFGTTAPLDEVDADDEEEGGLFRARGLSSAKQPAALPPAQAQPPAEQHQQASEGPLSTRGDTPAPLPRRVPPVLVSDHGRTVESGAGGGRHARPPSAQATQQPTWPQQRRQSPTTDQQPPLPSRNPRPAQGRPPGPDQQPTADRNQPTADRNQATPGYDRLPGRGDGPGWNPPVPDQTPAPSGERPAPSWSPEQSAPPPATERPVPAPRASSGLPKRVRQASLAPQLKKDPMPQNEADRYPVDTDPERDAEQARATMSSLQRGWQRGRRQNSTGLGGTSDTAPGTTHEGDGR